MKILIVKTSALGDIVHAYPAVHYLREKFPDAEIDWAVESKNRALVTSLPFINRTLFFSRGSFWEFLKFGRELRRKKYDVVYDFQGNCKSGLITFFARAKKKVGFGKKTVAEWPNVLVTTHKFNPPPGMNIREDYLFLAAEGRRQAAAPEIGVKPPHSKENCVILCPFSAWENKQITEEALIEFGSLLQKETGCRLFIAWGSDKERKRAEKMGFELLPKLSLLELQKAMGEARLVVAMDSLPLHLAAAAGVPTFSFFGPSNGAKYAPPGHFFFQGECPYGRSFEKRCPILRSCPTGACLRSVSGKELFRYFLDSEAGRNLSSL